MRKQITYDSLKAVLQYFGPVKRLEITNRIPSVRGAERVVPMKIGVLEIGDMEVTVDGAKFKFYMHQDYPEDQISEMVKKSNNNGTTHHDFDQFGVADFSADTTVYPGDVIIKTNGYERDHQAVENNRVHLMEQMVEMLRNQLDADQNYAMLNPNDRYNPKNMIRDTEKMLIPFSFRRDNVPLPYKITIVFERTDRNGVRTVQHFKNNKQIHLAWKHLLNQLFGRTALPIQVGRFEINRTSEYTVIRFPDTAKFKIGPNGVLRIQQDEQMYSVYETLKPFILDLTEEECVYL